MAPYDERRGDWTRCCDGDLCGIETEFQLIGASLKDPTRGRLWDGGLSITFPVVDDRLYLSRDALLRKICESVHFTVVIVILWGEDNCFV
jgi:hypothetical protein